VKPPPPCTSFRCARRPAAWVFDHVWTMGGITGASYRCSSCGTHQSVEVRDEEACRCGGGCEHLEPIDETDVDPIADTDRPVAC
jgi:hypothetical protein